MSIRSAESEHRMRNFARLMNGEITPEEHAAEMDAKLEEFAK